jgi:hypothetical protein
MATLSNNLGGKTSKMSNDIFVCDLCNYKCSKKFNYDRHLLSAKHKNQQKMSKNEENEQKPLYCCENCGKEYNDRTGLWRHKKKDNCVNNIVTDNDDKNNKLIEYLMKENKEMKEFILEIVKNGSHNTTNNTTNNTNHTNSHNKAFNLNFFLNETCKNAMNITDFIDSIKLQLPDLIDVGELGYVEGISKIILKNLNNLDETERPIHCTDKKRETMYVKDQGQWEKEDEKNTKLTKAVKRVANKNIDLLPRFREKYPEYSNSSSKISDKYDKMVIEVMETDPVKNEKIIRNISKVTTIKGN